MLEERPPAHADRFHRPEVDRVDALADGGIEIREREEGPMPQGGEHPALGDLHADFGFGFVFRPRHPRRDHDRAVVAASSSYVRLTSGSYGCAVVTPLFRLSGTQIAVLPWKYASIRMWAPTQDGRSWLRVASA